MITAILVFGGVGSLAAGVHQDEAQVLLKSAAHQELVQGDLEAAIETYQKILDQYPGERNVAAEALLKLGMSYEKLGKNGAKEAYARLVRDYADQSEQAQRARIRLEELAQTDVRSESGPAMKRIWVNSEKNVVADFTGTPSPDGRYFSFVEWGTGDVAVFDLLSGNYRYLTSGKGAAYSSAFSPDGSEVAYCLGELGDETGWELRIVGARKGNPQPSRLILKTSYRQYLHVNDWSPGGQGILVSFEQMNGQSGLGFVTPDAGELTILKTFERNTPYAMISPNGKYIAYNFPPDPDKEDRDIYLLASDGSREERVVVHPAVDRLIDWSPTGDRLIFTSDRGGTVGIWSQPVADGKAIGEAKLVKSDVGSGRFIGITKSGHIYFHGGKRLSDISTVGLNPEDGQITQDPTRLPSIREGKNRGPSWSPDGNYLAYRSGGGSHSGALMIRSVKSGLEKEIKPDSLRVSGRLAWSPDSKYILCNVKGPSGHWALHLFERSTEQFRLVREPNDNETILYPVGWSPDGKEIYFNSVFTGRSILARNLETGVERKIFEQSLRASALSPDAKHLAVSHGNDTNLALNLVSTATGKVVANLYQVPDPEANLRNLVWSPDGRYIYFKMGKRAEPTLYRIPSRGGEPTNVGLDVSPIGSISFSPDGRQLAFTSGESQDELWVMENFLEPKQQ
jgi:Tol biopolymer transport system component